MYIMYMRIVKIVYFFVIVKLISDKLTNNQSLEQWLEAIEAVLKDKNQDHSKSQAVTTGNNNNNTDKDEDEDIDMENAGKNNGNNIGA